MKYQNRLTESMLLLLWRGVMTGTEHEKDIQGACLVLNLMFAIGFLKFIECYSSCSFPYENHTPF